MDLNKELLGVLFKAKETGKYYNPNMLCEVLKVIEDYSCGHDNEDIEILFNWAVEMYSM